MARALPSYENISIIDAGAKGKGIAKAPDGRVIFVPLAVPGDVVDLKIVKKRRAYYDAVILRLVKASDARVEPVCEHFGYCGGCKWQAMDYKTQLYHKQKEVENNLKRIGHLELPEVSPIIGADPIYFYRNKMEFSFSSLRWLTPEEIAVKENIDNRNGLGFHIPGAWDKVLDINYCHLQEAPSNEIRNAIKDFSQKNELSFFNPREQTGLLRSLMIRIASTGEIMVLLQFYENNKPKRELLLSYLQETFPQITALQYVINPKQNDTIYDLPVYTYSGKDYITEQLQNLPDKQVLSFKIHAKSFYQTNSKQALALYSKTRALAAIKPNEVVYDLYTGIGSIALFVARDAKKVIGIESVPEAIENAKENAQLNNIKNIAFYCGDMRKVFNEEFTNAHEAPDVVITDPPRDGMHKDVVEHLLKLAPNRIVYVSCNSATQARDLALLKEKYSIAEVQPVDMFPQTHHVENIVLLQKHAQ